MNKKSFILTIATGILVANGVFASNLTTERDDRLINSITYIEDDSDFELGFDTADYLPEGFDPYEIYVNLDAVIFIEDEVADDVKTKRHLPANFDAYAYPTDVAAFNYIDQNDAFELDFDTQAYLPEGFDAYKANMK
ncbi:hypothetical protein SAMN05421636_11312 [Pricia antarctica]|uniref:Uncharacterized protein n=1 Tax=Pricia antarctica TaxID=641691 RepID=A0A1G7IMB8_9FLAO|nr:hypothetical protein [Pricia antarctica]SDF13882.1 hypothetical protein SAMN05421636_11312 [Pricia antarctica]